MTTARKRLVLVLLVVIFAGGFGAFFLIPRDQPPEPPLPQGITDNDVRQTLEQARSKLLANPKAGSAWGDYGTVLLANLFDQEAKMCFLEASKRDPKDPRWPYALGQIASKREPEKALALLTTAADLARSSSEYRQAFTLTLAEALLERGDVDKAAAIFDEQRLPPDPERAEYGLGLVAISRNDDATATRHFKAAANHPSCRKQAKAQLALLARSRGDVNGAKQLEAEASAVEQDPPWPDPYLDYVVTLQVGVRGSQRRIALLERDGKFQEAVNAFLQQAKANRTAQALTGAGVNLARLKRYDEALGYLQEAVQLDAADSNAHYTLALVLFTKWEKIVSLDANAGGAKEAFTTIVEHARKTTELKPDHARAHLFWGLALKYLGDPKAAIEPLRRGLTIEPEMFDLHLALGQVLAASGDRTGAIASLNIAKQLRPTDPRPPQELAKLGQ